MPQLLHCGAGVVCRVSPNSPLYLGDFELSEFPRLPTQLHIPAGLELVGFYCQPLQVADLVHLGASQAERDGVIDLIPRAGSPCSPGGGAGVQAHEFGAEGGGANWICVAIWCQQKCRKQPPEEPH